MRYDFSGLPNRIKESRERVEMSREQLGKLVGGLSRQAVARWEQSYEKDRNSVPDLETISKIADALRVDFLWLLTGQRYVEDLEDGPGGTLIPVFLLQNYHIKKQPEFFKKTPTAVPDGTDGLTVDDVANMPEFLPGDICFMAPCSEPQPNEMMLARLIDKRVNVFGRCVISGFGVGGKQIFEIVPLAEGFPKVSSRDDEIELLAVLVGHYKDYTNRRRR